LISTMVPATGRFLMPFDVQYKRRVAVIGADVAEGLFGKGDPLDREFKIGRYDFRVIGVMEKQGGSFFGGPNFDRQVFIPIATFNRAFGNQGGRAGVEVSVKAPPGKTLEDFESETEGLMRSIRGLKPIEKNDFSINKLDTILDMYNSTMGVVMLVGLAITSISLFVGGVGVMNIMLVSVTERTKEIGIRKAIGAVKRDIVTQFLTEAMTLSAIGGVIGISVGLAISTIVRKVSPLATATPLWSILVGLGVSISIGLFFGIYPAWKAAKLDPVEALRYE